MRRHTGRPRRTFSNSRYLKKKKGQVLKINFTFEHTVYIHTRYTSRHAAPTCSKALGDVWVQVGLQEKPAEVKNRTDYSGVGSVCVSTHKTRRD